MKVSKWVDFGVEVDIDINFTDVRAAMAEAFQRATDDPLGEEPSRFDIARAISSLGTFLKALPDEHIAVLTEAQRKLTAEFLAEHSKRFVVIPAPDLTRCAVCGWPLKERIEGGCTKGNCSQRPLPLSAYDPKRAIAEGYSRYETIRK